MSDCCLATCKMGEVWGNIHIFTEIAERVLWIRGISFERASLSGVGAENK